VPTLIIGGMHRSGTTLTARWLHNCGLFIGDELMQSSHTHSNPSGLHYEDVGFLKFHLDLLLANGLSKDGYIIDEAVKVSADFRQHAKQLVTARQSHNQWGWKEPRTCLLMELWQALLPDAHLLIVYRPYEYVADSLLRRKLDHPKRQKRWLYKLRFHNLDTHVAQFIQIWGRYNRDLLAAAERASEKTLVVRVDDLAAHSSKIIFHMKTAWGFTLDDQKMDKIFEKKRLAQKTKYVNLQTPQVAIAAKAADEIYIALEQWRERTLVRLMNQTHIDD
jgi:hypothetical protein